MYTTTARKRVSPVTEAESEAQSRFSMEAMPNSAILPMAGVPSGRPESSSDLGNRIRQRLPGVQERAQAQIATAEQEADRLSASVTSGSPEAVKAAMGRKLGADFSGVRDDLEAKGYAFVSAEVEQVPDVYNQIEDPEAVKKMEKLLEMLEDNDDVQNVYHNWEQD